jgi:hypothetical protein
MKDDDECSGEHVWRLSDSDDCVWRKCAYCLRREMMIGEWMQIEDAD